MEDRVLYPTDMISQLFGEGQCVPHQTGDALPQGVIETLNVVGLPGLLRDGFVSCRRNHPCVDGILVGIEHCPLAVHRGQVVPQLFRTVITTISHMKRNDLARLLVCGDSDPLLDNKGRT